MKRASRTRQAPARRTRLIERLEGRSLLASDLAASLPRFESVAALQDYLIEDGLNRYESLFGNEAWNSCWEICYPIALDLVAGTPANHVAADGALSSRNSATSISGTNVQVEGVDEGDVVETDGRHLFALGGDSLAIVDVSQPDSLSLVAKVELPGTGVAEFLRGDRLTVITTESYWGEGLPWMTMRAAEGLRPLPVVAATQSVTVTVFDVSDPSAPRELEQTKLDGAYRDSRAIDDKVLVIVENSNLTLPSPQVECEESTSVTEESGDAGSGDALEGQTASRFALPWNPPYSTGACTYETKDAWLARMYDELDTNLVDRLPHFTSYGPDHEFARAGLLHEPADLVRPTSPDASQIVSLVTFDVDDADPGVLAAEGIVAGWSSTVYASTGAVILVEPTWNATGDQGAQSRLLFFRWNAEVGAPLATAVGVVPGSLLNSYSLDEHDGIVHLATTAWENSGDPAGWQTRNRVFTLKLTGHELPIVGSLENFGEGERIQSVRFQGDVAYVVTFRQTDPLFTFDLSNPAKPRLLGELVLPGFSGYLQQLDATHLLGMGSAPREDGVWVQRLSLFDVGDLSAPRLLDTYDLPAFSWSTASYDPHALLWNAGTHVLTLPLQYSEPEGTVTNEEGYSWVNYRTVDQLVALRIENPETGGVGDRFERLGVIGHDSPVRRGVTIDDRIYSLSNADLKLADATPDTHMLDVLPLFTWPDETPVAWLIDDVLPMGASVRMVDGDGETKTAAPADVTPTPLDDDGFSTAMTAAKDELAGRLKITRAAVRFVSAEPLLDSPAGEGATFQIVLAVGDDRYLFRATASGDVELLDDAFEFREQPNRSPWSNSRNRLDASDDGHVAPQDALIVINELNTRGARELRAQFPLRAIAPQDSSVEVTFFWDVDGDRFIAPIDALQIINWLNDAQGEGASGEGADEVVWNSGASDSSTHEFLAPIDVAPTDVSRRAIVWAQSVDAVVACVEAKTPWWEL